MEGSSCYPLRGTKVKEFLCPLNGIINEVNAGIDERSRLTKRNYQLVIERLRRFPQNKPTETSARREIRRLITRSEKFKGKKKRKNLGREERD